MGASACFSAPPCRTARLTWPAFTRPIANSSQPGLVRFIATKRQGSFSPPMRSSCCTRRSLHRSHVRPANSRVRIEFQTRPTNAHRPERVRFRSREVPSAHASVRQCLSKQAGRVRVSAPRVGLFAPQHALRWDGDSCCHTRPYGKRRRYIALLVGKLGDESIVAGWKKEAKRSAPRCLLSSGVLAKDVNRRPALEYEARSSSMLSVDG